MGPCLDHMALGNGLPKECWLGVLGAGVVVGGRDSRDQSVAGKRMAVAVGCVVDGPAGSVLLLLGSTSVACQKVAEEFVSGPLRCIVVAVVGMVPQSVDPMAALVVLGVPVLGEEGSPAAARGGGSPVGGS